MASTISRRPGPARPEHNLLFDVSDVIDRRAAGTPPCSRASSTSHPTTTVLEGLAWVGLPGPDDGDSSCARCANAAARADSEVGGAGRLTGPRRPPRPIRHPRNSMTLLRALIPTVLALPLLAACTENAASTDPGDPRVLTVDSTDDGCELSATEAPAGNLSFAGHQRPEPSVTEFYLLAEDGLRIVGRGRERRSRPEPPLVVAAPAGTYVAACKPGMSGRRHPRRLHVTDSDEGRLARGRRGADRAGRPTATRTTSQDQSDQLVAKTEQFVRLYQAGDDDAPAPSTPTPAPTGSGSRPWPSPSATSTR